MRFANPYFLLLFFIPLVYYFLKYRKTGKLLNPTLLFSSALLFSKQESILTRFFNPLSDILIGASMLFLVIALARPLGGQTITGDKFFGIDIVLAIDVSGSMLDIDTIPSGLPYRDMLGQRIYYDIGHKLIPLNRINSAKKVINEYVQKQEFNRIGLVLFGDYSYTKCPLTLDKTMLTKVIEDIQFSEENQRTAIGMGIATSINRLKKSEAKNKVIILLTDGNNNSGMIDPFTAASIAGEMGIRIYTIGLGNPDGYLLPASEDFNEYKLQIGAGLDEQTLQKIADTTGGKFYRAYDPDSLRKIYEDIDKLEKSKIEIKRRVLYKENFLPFLAIGLVFLVAYIALGNVVTKIP